MEVVEYIFLFAAIAAFLLGAGFIVVHLAFLRPQLTGQAVGKLIRKSSKKNVPVYGKNFPGRGPAHPVATVKNQTTGVYMYAVGGKRYQKRHRQLVSPKQMSHQISICFLKRMPQISYVKSDMVEPRFWIYGIACICVGLIVLLGYLQIHWM